MTHLHFAGGFGLMSGQTLMPNMGNVFTPVPCRNKLAPQAGGICIASSAAAQCA
jgi:hypothetical protein